MEQTDIGRSGSAPAAADRAPPERVHDFIGTLIRAYGRAREANRQATSDTADRAGGESGVPDSLLLAEAATRYARDDARGLRRPLQFAVLGPTQTGKSTVVNLLLARDAARVSPLAGYTVHPQGFWLARPGEDEGWIDRLFPGPPAARRCGQDELDRERLDCFSLQAIEGRGEALAALPPCVIWDTPDFDSLSAHSYQRNVLETAALADAWLVVISKEKYSDLSVWRILALLSPLGRPLILCLNKITPDAAEVIEQSLRRRLEERTPNWRDVPVVRVAYVAHPAEIAAGALAGPAGELRDRAAAALSRAAAGRSAGGVVRLLEEHWSEWTLPLRMEHAALAEWSGRVEAALAESLQVYRRDYLDHPQRYDSFRRATAELLQLLELPGLAGTLGSVRQIVTWPARQLLAAGRSLMTPRNEQSHLTSEQSVLRDVIDELLTSLQRDAARKADRSDAAAVWRAIAARLEQDRPALEARFTQAAEEHHQRMQREIHEAAGRLFEKLRERPALLGTLRAARVTADAASILLAIKTGGAHVNDLLFAPAMFGLTSMLTEGALGGYMRHVADDLKKRQLEHVRAALIHGAFAGELHGVAGRLDDAAIFGISPEALNAARTALDAWKEDADG